MPRCCCGASLTSSSARFTARSRFTNSSECPRGMKKESFLPRCLERLVVTDRDPFERESERFGILRERLSASAMDRARELIENDDKRQPRPRTLRPAVELAPLGLIQ